MRIRRAQLMLALLVSALTSAGLQTGCDDPFERCNWPGACIQPTDNPNECCALPNTTYWECTATAVGPAPVMGTTVESCSEYLAGCFESQAAAVSAAEKATLSGRPLDKIISNNCTPGTCGKVGVKPQDEACGPPIILGGDAGPPGPCIAGTDPCTTCLDQSCCAQYDACLAAEGSTICDAVLGYWAGTRPAPEGVSSPAIDALNSCATSACGDVGTCTAYLPRLFDGGIP